LFYEPSLAPNLNEIFLNEQESRHAIKVLRHGEGDQIALTDGAGYYYEGVIEQKEKRQCRVAIQNVTLTSPPEPVLHLAIAPLKNRNRLEWVIEKATELGVHAFDFIHTRNTERTRLNEDRVERIVISAMKQSLKTYKPSFTVWPDFSQWLNERSGICDQLFMAECETTGKPYLSSVCQAQLSTMVLFGPEGDLSPEEIIQAGEAGFQRVSLGEWRLRTETAVLTGLAMVHSANQIKPASQP